MISEKMNKAAEKVCRFKEQRKADYYAAMATMTYGLLCTPNIAFAATANDMLDTILNLAKTAVSLLGGALIVWGGVKFGLAVKDHQGGNAMAESVATIGGGAIILAAATYFGTVMGDYKFGN